MKTLRFILPCIAVSAFAELTPDPSATNQMDGAVTVSTAPVTSSLQINTRSNEERIAFLMQVADAYFKEDNFDAAVSAYERILKLDPEHKQANYIIAYVYINAKRYEDSEKLLTKLIEADPEDFTLINNLAWLYATAEDPKYRDGKKAIELAQQAMVLAPDDHLVWSTLSEGYYITGEYRKAYRAILQMVRLATRYGKGVTQEQVNEYNEQIQKCKRAWDAEKMLKGIEDDDEDL